MVETKLLEKRYNFRSERGGPFKESFYKASRHDPGHPK